jgi:hypothetical protein
MIRLLVGMRRPCTDFAAVVERAAGDIDRLEYPEYTVA